MKRHSRIAWEIYNSANNSPIDSAKDSLVDKGMIGKFSVLDKQKSEIKIPKNLQILRENIRMQKTIGRISIQHDL
jgi:hypothetical protein